MRDKWWDLIRVRRSKLTEIRPALDIQSKYRHLLSIGNLIDGSRLIYYKLTCKYNKYKIICTLVVLWILTLITIDGQVFPLLHINKKKVSLSIMKLFRIVTNITIRRIKFEKESNDSESFNFSIHSLVFSFCCAKQIISKRLN